MTRKQAIVYIRTAGYHNDSRTALRIYIENRVSYQTYKTSYLEGVQAKKDGMRCSCNDCRTQRDSVSTPSK